MGSTVFINGDRDAAEGKSDIVIVWVPTFSTEEANRMRLFPALSTSPEVCMIVTNNDSARGGSGNIIKKDMREINETNGGKIDGL